MGRKTTVSKLKKDWKTSVTSLVTAGLLGYAGYTTDNPTLMLAAAGLMVNGVLSKDAE